MPSSIPNQSQADFEREMNEWRCLVGKAILRFGDIEIFTLECLHRIPSDKIIRVAEKCSLAKITAKKTVSRLKSFGGDYQKAVMHQTLLRLT